LGRAIIGVLLIAAVVLAVTAWVMGDLLGGFAIKDPAAATYELLAWAIAPWAAALTAWVMATVVGVTNALPMQVGVARVMYAMGRDRQLPTALAKIIVDRAVLAERPLRTMGRAPGNSAGREHRGAGRPVRNEFNGPGARPRLARGRSRVRRCLGEPAAGRTRDMRLPPINS
jgi:hypothetical protein